MNDRRLVVREEEWPIEGAFTISRNSKTAAEVIVVEIHQDGQRGRGECVPYRRYGETREGTAGRIEALRDEIENGTLGRPALQRRLEPGAARNALDCALWDLEAKLSGIPAWCLAGVAEPEPVTTAFTIGLDEPEAMAESATENGHRPLLKLKLGGDGDILRVRAVREAAPDATLIVDANEAWTPLMFSEYGGELAELGVELVEQPVPAGSDGVLRGLERAVPVCADESVHDTSTLADVALCYDFVNIKLDKTGGLTEALRLADAARSAGIGIMLGCMVGTSLSMAPATLLGSIARFVDLDGPLLLAQDRDPGIRYVGSTMHPPPPELWG
ncbi:MAG: dipeptide epimerase [Alphaproteobacteria bacterium]|nr:dipeptide epimerase [Alphaproteobacteria bacterium]MCY4495824.1 dipeptide epimerase [Rhodospirillaceae bacterium]